MISFRQMQESDISLVLNWLKQPHVSEFWFSVRNSSDEELHEKYHKRLKEGVIELYIMTVNNHDIGLIQTYFLEHDNPFHVNGPAKGIDLFIGDKDYLNRGFGSQLIELFMTQHVFNDSEVSYACIDPEVANERAIHVYEKCGFVPVHAGYCPHSKLLTCYMIRQKNKKA